MTETTAGRSTPADAGKERVAWVDYSKGICSIAVVCLYATYYVQDAQGGKGWMLYWVDFAAPFRMPDFFLLAGLFLSATITRPWRSFLDTKIVHFVYFLVLWTSIYFILHTIQDARGAADPPLWLEYLGWYVDPFHMLWFIALLPVFYVVTRLLRPVPVLIVLAAAAALQIAEIDTGWSQLDRFCERYVYFYAGYSLAPLAFRVAAWAGRQRGAALAILIVWAVANEALVLGGLAGLPVIGLVLGFAGAAAVIVAGTLLSRYDWMRWLRYIGEHSIVVFLAFFLATVVTARILAKLDIVDDIGTQQLVVIVVSVAAPFVLRRVLRGTPGRYLFERPDWARLASGSRDARRPDPVSALGTTPAAMPRDAR